MKIRFVKINRRAYPESEEIFEQSFTLKKIRRFFGKSQIFL
jgi:hypothetical protein